MGETIVAFSHSESMGSAIRDPLFSLLPSLKKLCRADISSQTTSLAILLWEDVKEHVLHTSPAVPLSSATNARSYGEMAFWREVPVFAPYRCREREGSDSDSGAETGEFLFYRCESAAPPKWSCHGKLTHFLPSELK